MSITSKSSAILQRMHSSRMDVLAMWNSTTDETKSVGTGALKIGLSGGVMVRNLAGMNHPMISPGLK